MLWCFWCFFATEVSESSVTNKGYWNMMKTLMRDHFAYFFGFKRGFHYIIDFFFKLKSKKCYRFYFYKKCNVYKGWVTNDHGRNLQCLPSPHRSHPHLSLTSRNQTHPCCNVLTLSQHLHTKSTSSHSLHVNKHSRHTPAAMSWHCPNTLTPSPHQATHFMWMTVADTPLHTLSQHPHPKSTHFMLMTTTDTCCPNTLTQSPHTSC